MGVIGASAIVVLMVAIVIDVIVRYITGGSVPAMVEISMTALVVSIFFSLAWAGVDAAHVGVTLLADRMGPRTNRIFGLMTWGLGSFLTGWFVVATAERAFTATEAGETRMGLVEWPLWPLRWVIVAGFLSFLFVCLVNLARVARGHPAMGEEAPYTADTHSPIDPPEGP